ncbi:MAG: MFS transporter [Acidimicrobiales bacterium]|nr:MAG: MFS transporter [Acidimicrobiales bacterium]
MVAAIAPLHLFGALAPDIQEEFGFGDAEQGYAIAAFFAVSALLSSWGGALSDRWGPSKALRSGTALALAGAVGVVFAPSYGVVVIALCVAAIGNAINQPSNNTFISGGVPLHRRGLAMGIKQSAIPTSTGLAGLALPTIAVSLGWEAAYVGAALLAGAAILAIPHVDPPVAAPATRTRYRPSPLMLRVAIGAGFGAMAIANIGTFLVRSLTDAGFSRTLAGTVQVVGSVALITSRVGWGALMDRHSDWNRFAFAAGLLVLGTAAFPMIATGHDVVAVVGALLAYGFGWSWPGVVHLATVEHNPDATGAASGVLQASMFVGAMTGPALFGVVADAHSFGWAWMMVCGFSAVAAAMMSAAALRAEPG